MASVLPPDFNMLKKQVSQPSTELSDAQRSLIDDFIARIESSAQPSQVQPSAAATPTNLTKAVKTTDIGGRRAYVMPEGPVVYADREQPSEAQPQPQIAPEDTGYSNPAYVAEDTAPAPMPTLPEPQEIPRSEMLSAALAGPGGSGKARSESIPPASASQKVVTPQEQKRQRKIEQASGVSSAGQPVPLAPQGAVTKAPGAIPPPLPAAAPRISNTLPGTAKTDTESTIETQAPAASQRSVQQHIQRLYPQQTQEGMQEGAKEQFKSAPQMLPNAGMTPAPPQYKVRKPAVAPTVPAAPTAPASSQTTSSLPPMFNQLKAATEKSVKVKPAMYADVGDVSPGAGSMLVEIEGGQKIPIRKRAGGYQANFGTDKQPDWNDIAEGTPLASKLTQLDKEDQGADQYLDPVQVIGTADRPIPVYSDPQDPNGYNIGAPDRPVYRQIAISPDMIPSMYDSKIGRVYNEGIGDYYRPEDDSVPAKLNSALRSFEKAYDTKRRNFVVARNDNGLPELISADEAGRRIFDRASETYLERRSIDQQLQRQASGEEYDKATREIYRQLENRDLQHLGIATSIEAGTSGASGLSSAAQQASAAAKNRARSNVAINEGASSGSSVSGVQIDTPYGRQMRAGGYAASYSYEQPDRTDLVLLSKAAPYTGQQQNITSDDVQQYYNSLLDNYYDAVVTKPKRELASPNVNPFIFLQQFDQMRRSKNPQAFATFVNNTVGRSQFGQGKKVQVGNYSIGLTATPEPIETTISKQGEERSGVTIGQGDAGSGSPRKKSALVRDFSNKEYKSVDDLLAYQASVGPQTIGQAAETYTNALAYSLDPEASSDYRALKARAEAALNGLSFLSDKARSMPYEQVAKVVANNIQHHMNIVMQNFGRLARERDNAGNSKLTSEIVGDLYKGIEKIYGANKPAWLTGEAALKNNLMSSNPGLDYVSDASKMANTVGVKYITDAIRGYSDQKSSHIPDGDTFKQIGASTFGAPESIFAANIFKNFGGDAAAAQDVRNYFGIMMSGRSAKSVESDVQKKLKAPMKSYRSQE